MADRRGGSRPGAGRPKGAPNKATTQAKATLAELAKALAPEALEALASVMRTGESEAARVSAANAILDRGYGKPMQVMPDGDGNEAPAMSITIRAAAPVKDVSVTRSDG